MARIVVIEDEPEERSTIGRHLAVEEHQVFEAGDDGSAIEFPSEHIELTIRLALQLPRPMSGM